MNISHILTDSKMNNEDLCLADSATTHTIKSKKYFSTLTMLETNVNKISGSTNLIEGFGKANLILPRGTKFTISNALFSSKSKRNLLSFKDIRQNGYHVETNNKNNREYLYITFIVLCEKRILETLSVFYSGLYYTHIRVIEIYATMNPKFMNLNMFTVWHDRLGHPVRRIIENFHGHPLKNQKILQSNELSCIACSQGKLIIRPSPAKVGVESPTFLERIHGDICEPINSPSGPFRYFMVLIDTSSRWSHVCLLSRRNLAFARLLAQIIKLRAQFPDYTIKNIQLDNAGEFTSQAFNNYCMSIEINIEHSLAHVHTQKGLVESFIKRLQLIVRPLLMSAKLPLSI
ncbi:hypothetical protein IC575_019497 [Cucumis melo]